MTLHIHVIFGAYFPKAIIETFFSDPFCFGILFQLTSLNELSHLALAHSSSNKETTHLYSPDAMTCFQCVCREAHDKTTKQTDKQK